MRSNKKIDIQEIVERNLDLIVDSDITKSKFILSISGGIDSVVLLDIFLKIKQKKRINFMLFHMNYGMHSNANKMQDLCVRIASDNKLKIFKERINPNKFKNTNIEAQARYARYDKLLSICSKNKINYILTGHHEDDQIETIYMHKEIHKSSWISQIGIRSKRSLYKDINLSIDVIRPMLSISRKKIINYAKNNKLKFYNDPTNNDFRFLRNKIRHEIKEKKQDENFRFSILKTSYNNKIKIDKISSDIDKKISMLLFFSFYKNFAVLNKKELSVQSIDFFTLFFKKIISENFGFEYHASSLFWNNLSLFINSPKRGKHFILNEDQNIKICKSSKYIYVYTDKKRMKKIINKIGNYNNRLGVISVIDSSFNYDFKDKNKIILSKDYIGSLVIDYWNFGDKCTNISGTNMKVSDIFIDNKLSIFEKKYYPIIKFKNQIIWIPGMFKAKIEQNINKDKNILLNWNSIL